MKPRHIPRHLAATLATTLLATISTPANALPNGPTVVAGSVGVSQPATHQLEIRQDSNRAVVDWRNFDIAAGEQVRIIQPGRNAALLSRVLSPDPTRIYGTLSADGQLFLVNPNGVIFGAGSRIDVGSLMASTADIGNNAFMDGRLDFSQPGQAKARLVNEGQIVAGEGGFVALAGPNITNSGSISARLGRVALASGDMFTLDFRGDQLINVMVDQAALSTLRDREGQALTRYIDQSGEISAAGGRIEISAASAANLLTVLVNLGGVTLARTVEQRPGVILLHGDADTQLTLTGLIDASGSGTSDRGGQVDIQGGTIGITGQIDVRGAQGGGFVSVGTAGLTNTLDLAATSRLNADATGFGDGGNILLQSYGDIRAGGQISALSGPTVGRGGQVNIAAGRNLELAGSITTGQGYIALSAGNDIQLTDNLSIQASAGSFYARNALEMASDKTLTAEAGFLSLYAGRDINAQSVVSTGDLSADAGGAINFAAPLSVGSLAVNARTAPEYIGLGQNVHFNSIDSQGPIRVAGNNIEVSGNIRSAGEIALRARQDILLSGTVDSEAATPGTAISLQAGGNIFLPDFIFNPRGDLRLDAGGMIASTYVNPYLETLNVMINEALALETANPAQVIALPRSTFASANAVTIKAYEIRGIGNIKNGGPLDIQTYGDMSLTQGPSNFGGDLLSATSGITLSSRTGSIDAGYIDSSLAGGLGAITVHAYRDINILAGVNFIDAPVKITSLTGRINYISSTLAGHGTVYFQDITKPNGEMVHVDNNVPSIISRFGHDGSNSGKDSRSSGDEFFDLPTQPDSVSVPPVFTPQPPSSFGDAPPPAPSGVAANPGSIQQPPLSSQLARALGDFEFRQTLEQLAQLSSGKGMNEILISTAPPSPSIEHRTADDSERVRPAAAP